MTILCSLKNINLNFGNKPLFHDSELIIHLGDKIGLLGLNGKGKSSLFKIINNELTPDNSIPPFLFDKSNNPENPFTTFMVPQEIPLNNNEDTSIKDFILNFYPKIKKATEQLDQINNSLSNNNIKEVEDELIEQQKKLLDYLEHENWWQVVQQYESYLKVFNITDFSVSVSILSGGEQKKVLLSLGLSTPAEIILWDEPTNHLDIETIKLLENELEATNKTFLIISHDRFLLSKVTNKIFQIQNKKIISYNGKYTEYLDYLSQQDQQRQKQLAKLNNTLSRETEWMRQGVKARGTKSKKRIEGYHNLRQEVDVLKSFAKKELKLNINESQKKNKKLIELKGTSFGYENKTLINDLSLSIYRGDKIGIVGANGIGKSTLTDLISKKLTPQSGEIKYYPELIIQNFSQKRDELNPKSTPFELLGEGTDTLKLSDGRSKNVIAYFKDFLFSQDEVHRPINTFSGGEKNRIQLALNLKRFGDI
ncbi:MAG: ABC-F family ATP-binding cassette domain-containing protein, partial [Bdellovibrionales bacterium]|nr:ABC-F family ATP-binding cassette domain-containing protein [Bdellovibrionales bacterium]